MFKAKARDENNGHFIFAQWIFYLPSREILLFLGRRDLESKEKEKSVSLRFGWFLLHWECTYLVRTYLKGGPAILGNPGEIGQHNTHMTNSAIHD